jgi:hypothetical protein
MRPVCDCYECRVRGHSDLLPDLPDEDRAVLREHAPKPYRPLDGATCEECGAPATWWMDNPSGLMYFGCDEHRPYQPPTSISAPSGGTARALGPIAKQTLLWVAQQRKRHEPLTGIVPDAYAGRVRRVGLIPLDDLRRIELCALATLDISHFDILYGRDYGQAPEVQDER